MVLIIGLSNSSTAVSTFTVMNVARRVFGIFFDNSLAVVPPPIQDDSILPQKRQRLFRNDMLVGLCISLCIMPDMIGGRHSPALDPDKLPFLCKLIHIPADRVFRNIDQIDQIIVHETSMNTDLFKYQIFSLLLGQSNRNAVGFKFSHSL